MIRAMAPTGAGRSPRGSVRIVRTKVRVLARVDRVLFPSELRPAGVDRLHRDAAVDGTDQAAQVAADAGLLVDLAVGATVVGPALDRLVRAVLAGRVAEAATDALLLIDLGDDLVVEVELLPARVTRDGRPDQLLRRGQAALEQVVREAVDHVLDDAEAVVHDRRADLHRRR